MRHSLLTSQGSVFPAHRVSAERSSFPAQLTPPPTDDVMGVFPLMYNRLCDSSLYPDHVARKAFCLPAEPLWSRLAVLAPRHNKSLVPPVLRPTSTELKPRRHSGPRKDLCASQFPINTVTATREPTPPPSCCEERADPGRTLVNPAAPVVVPPPVSIQIRPLSPETPPPKVCISCGSTQSPCWRPSWSVHAGQLCNSCGLRFKKTGVRCLNRRCARIPSKGEWTLILKALAVDQQAACPSCNGPVEQRS